LRAAILRLARDKRLHVIWTFILLRIFSSKAGPVVPGAHAQVARKILRRLVRDLLQLPNMTMEFHDPVGGRAGSGSHGLCGSKISEYFCGIFVLLCYIPAPLTNQN
jgi:hypothetical protein